MAAVERVFASDNASALANVDAGQIDAVLEGGVLDAIDAGGQVDGGEPVAVVDGCVADVLDAGANGDTGELLATTEGEVADGGDAVGDGDAGQVVAPGGTGAPVTVFAVGDVGVVIHFSRATDGQAGVVAVAIPVEGPRGVVAARAADGLQRGGDGGVAGAKGEAGRSLVGSKAIGSSRGGEGPERRIGRGRDGGGGIGEEVLLAAVGHDGIGGGRGEARAFDGIDGSNL